MLSLSVRVLPSLSGIPREGWNRLFPSAIESWDYFRACEIAPAPEFATSVLVAFVGEQLVGAAPLFDATFRIDMALGPYVGSVASWLGRRAPRVMNPAITAMGSPQSDECSIGILDSTRSAERTEIFAALLKGLAMHADARGSSIIVLKDVRDADTHWIHAPLTAAGFARIASLPVAVLDLPYGNESEYLATFSPRFRSEMRRKMRQASGVTVELRDNIDDIQHELEAMFQATRKKRGADYGSFDDVGTGFFAQLVRALKGSARVMLCRHEGRLVSFNLFVVDSTRVFAKFIGMSYPKARELNLYYFNWMMMVRYCIEHGVPVLQTGQSTYEIKTRLGSKLKKSWIYFRHPWPVTNKVVHAIAPFLALDRSDPDLRELGERAPYKGSDR